MYLIFFKKEEKMKHHKINKYLLSLAIALSMSVDVAQATVYEYKCYPRYKFNEETTFPEGKQIFTFNFDDITKTIGFGISGLEMASIPEFDQANFPKAMKFKYTSCRPHSSGRPGSRRAS